MDIMDWVVSIFEALLSPTAIAEGAVTVVGVVVGAGLSWWLYVRGAFWNWATSDAIFLYKALLRISFVLRKLETHHSQSEQSQLVSTMKDDARDAGIYLRQIEGVSKDKSQEIEDALDSIQSLRPEVAPPERENAMLLIGRAVMVVKRMVRR